MKKETKESTKIAKEDKGTKATKAKMYKGLKSNFSSTDAKKFRGKRRRILFNYSNAIISASLKKDEKELQKECKSFLKMYKSQYVLNDMSVESLYVGSNDSKKDDIKRMIAIVQKSLSIKK